MSWLIHDPLTRFIAQIVVILAASRALGVIARRLGQPVVIAEIAAGIMLGPSVLGWLAPDVAETLFPTSSLGVLRLVSQLGLIFFMFLVGLELDLRHLRGRGRASFAISQTSIVVPFVLGVAMAFWLRPRFGAREVPFTAFALFMGAAMSITAFPVLARILNERNLLRTRVGAIAIACAAIDDVTAWCLLAFAVSVARTGTVGDALVTTAMALGYVGAMVLVVRPLLARAAARVTVPGAMSQNLVALVLLLVLLSSWTTELLGLHALFGAFAFGVILPKPEGFARALAERLEDLVVIILLPLFFAISGLRTEIGLIGSTEHVLTCVAIIAAASLGKFGGGTVAARLTGLSWRESGALGALLNTRGLMELIVLNIGLELGVITPTLFSMMVLMALATTVMTTPVLDWIYPPSVMARDLAADQPPAPTPASTFRVLACISHARAGPGMVTVARWVAGPDAEIVALYLDSSDRASDRVDDDPDLLPVELATAIDHGRALGVRIRSLSYGAADVAEEIVRAAATQDVDLVVLGSHKPVLTRTLIGGVVQDVMQQAAATVAVYVERARREPRRILVPFQGSPHDRAALALAGRIQRASGSELTLLHLVEPAGPRPTSHAAAVELEEAGGKVVVETVTSPSAAATVVERAAGFDLVVIGMGREWGLPERPLVLGLQPEHVMEACPTSLLVVHASARPG